MPKQAPLPEEPERPFGPFQLGAHKPRGNLTEEKVAFVLDETQSRRVRLMERLADVILDPTPEEQGRKDERCIAKQSDHVLIQVMMMMAQHVRDIPAEDTANRTAALTQLAKIAMESTKEANAASGDFMRIKEHADKMALEQKKLAERGGGKVPTMKEVMDRLAKKPGPEADE